MSINEILQSAYELSLEDRKELVKQLNENLDDPMLQMDPYFYERKKQVAQTIADMDSGKMKMIPDDEFWEEMDEFEKEWQDGDADKEELLNRIANTLGDSVEKFLLMNKIEGE